MNNKDITLKIKSGDKDLIASGSFMTHSGNEIKLEIESKEGILTLILIFVTDEDNKEVRKASVGKGQTTLEITFFNYKDTRFTIAPWNIGNIFNRELYIVYHIEPLYNTEIRNITYSFYLGEEVANG